MPASDSQCICNGLSRGIILSWRDRQRSREDNADGVEDVKDGDEDVSEQAIFLGYSVAKLSAYHNVLVTDLVNNYRADDIITELTNFL